MIKKYIEDEIKESILVKKMIIESKDIIENINNAAEIIINAYKNGNKVLIAGNGGSAADAQHIAGELVSKFYFDRPALPAIALTTDTSIITAIGNDYGFDKLFERQVQGQGIKGDVFIGITTSGKSVNVINALRECLSKEIKTIILKGSNKTEINELADVVIEMPSEITPRIQESHIMIGHILCAIVEKSIFNKEQR